MTTHACCSNQHTVVSNHSDNLHTHSRTRRTHSSLHSHVAPNFRTPAPATGCSCNPQSATEGVVWLEVLCIGKSFPKSRWKYGKNCMAEFDPNSGLEFTVYRDFMYFNYYFSIFDQGPSLWSLEKPVSVHQLPVVRH
jgi:hypothetical protein